MDINDIIAERFGVRGHATSTSAEGNAFALHVALTHAGIVTDQIYELAVQPAKGTVDEETVAAMARALLAHLGQMSTYVDALVQFTASLRHVEIIAREAEEGVRGSMTAGNA